MNVLYEYGDTIVISKTGIALEAFDVSLTLKSVFSNAAQVAQEMEEANQLIVSAQEAVQKQYDDAKEIQLYPGDKKFGYAERDTDKVRVIVQGILNLNA